MNHSRGKLLKGFNGNPPAQHAEIGAVEVASGLKLPADYEEFLLDMDGGEGVIGDEGYVILFRVAELIEMNEGYEVRERAPGLFLIGSDGGGEAFAYDMRSDTPPIVYVPFLPMEARYAKLAGRTFDEFLEFLSKPWPG